MAKQSARPRAKAAGGRPAGAGTSVTAESPRKYVGEQFALPEHGPMSAASMGKRALALLIDWGLCVLIARGLIHDAYWAPAVFAVEDYLLTASTGYTIGKRLLRIRVIRTSGAPVGPTWSAVRTVLLLTVVPALLSDRDLRGMHDRAADTIVVNM